MFVGVVLTASSISRTTARSVPLLLPCCRLLSPLPAPPRVRVLGMSFASGASNVDVRTVSGKKARKELKTLLSVGISLRRLPSREMGLLTLATGPRGVVGPASGEGGEGGVSGSRRRRKTLRFDSHHVVETLDLKEVIEVREGTLNYFGADKAAVDRRSFGLVTMHEDPNQRDPRWEMECNDELECQALVEQFRSVLGRR